MNFDATVEYLSSQGLGTVRDGDGRIYFVRGVWPGDHGAFRATTEREGRYQFAELVTLHKASPDRRDDPIDGSVNGVTSSICIHFGVGPKQCYGCPWIIAKDEAQQRQKMHRLVYAFDRVGLDSSVVKELWAAPSAFGYRSRAQFKSDGTELGYAGLRGEAIAGVDSCLTLSPKLSEQLKGLRAELPNEEWRPTEPHIWNYLEVDEEMERGDLRLNRRRPFQQVNKAQNAKMRRWVADRAAGRHTLELFAGSGNFTEVLVGEGQGTVEAYEVGEDAVRQLHGKALPGVTALRLDLYHPSATAALRPSRAEILCVNPPRAGLLKLARLARHLPELKEILYISCDIQTLVTDLQKIVKDGFRLVEVQPVDQMPQTPHLEILVRLVRVGSHFA